MLEPVVTVAKNLQEIADSIPYVGKIAHIDTVMLAYILLVLAGVLVLLFTVGVICWICKLKRHLMYRRIEKFFGIPDLSQYQVCRMGKPGSANYIEDGVNALKIEYPHWKYACDDGTKANKRFNKVIWEQSKLWLHSGRRVYVVMTRDPYDMTYLVHTLRDGGLDIPACQQELEKQEILERSKRSMDDIMQDIIDEMEGSGIRFVDACRQWLSNAGHDVSDAPRNKNDITLFFKNGAQPNVVRCQLVPRDYLVGIDEVKEFKESAGDLFADACTLITTGRISIAAAGYARSNNVDIVCNDRLMWLAAHTQAIPLERSFVAWELTADDITAALPDDLAKKILS